MSGLNRSVLQSCIGLKSNTYVQGTNLIASGQGNGILRRIWITLAGDPSTTSIIINVDGLQTFGNTSSSTTNLGINTTGLFLDSWLNIGNYSSLGACYFSDIMGSSTITVSAFSGYLAIDMPFRSSWSISLLNASSGGTYWVQPFIDTLIPPSINPYGALTLCCSTFNWQPTALQCCPLISTTSQHGVFLKGYKLTLTTNSTGNFAEGRFHMWNGGATVKTIFTDPGYSDGNENVPIPYSTGAVCVWQSTGIEDNFLSAYGFSGVPTTYNADTSIYATGAIPTPLPYNQITNETGLICNTAYPGNIQGASGTTVSMYRFFGTKGEGCPGALPNTNFTLTWTCGDVKGGSSGSLSTLVGCVYYYA